MPAGNAERVDVRIVDDIEREQPPRQRRRRVDALADHRQIRLGGGVIVELHLLRDLRSHLIAELPFLIERDAVARRAARPESRTGSENDDQNHCKKRSALQHR